MNVDGVTLEQAFEEYYVNFTHFAILDHWTSLVPEVAAQCMMRGAAIQGATDQPQVDFVIPLLPLKSKIATENLTVCQIRVKNSRSDHADPISPPCVHQNTRKPVVSLTLRLGSEREEANVGEGPASGTRAATRGHQVVPQPQGMQEEEEEEDDEGEGDEEEDEDESNDESEMEPKESDVSQDGEDVDMRVDLVSEKVSILTGVDANVGGDGELDTEPEVTPDTIREMQKKHYDITVYGCSSDVYRCMPKKVEGVYKQLLSVPVPFVQHDVDGLRANYGEYKHGHLGDQTVDEFVGKRKSTE
jgi:hypothetical protein